MEISLRDRRLSHNPRKHHSIPLPTLQRSTRKLPQRRREETGILQNPNRFFLRSRQQIQSPRSSQNPSPPNQLDDSRYRNLSRNPSPVSQSLPPANCWKTRLQHHKNEPLHRSAQLHRSRHATHTSLLIRLHTLEIPLHRPRFLLHILRLRNLRLHRRLAPQNSSLLRLFHDDMGHLRPLSHLRRLV